MSSNRHPSLPDLEAERDRLRAECSELFDKKRAIELQLQEHQRRLQWLDDQIDGTGVRGDDAPLSSLGGGGRGKRKYDPDHMLSKKRAQRRAHPRTSKERTRIKEITCLHQKGRKWKGAIFPNDSGAEIINLSHLYRRDQIKDQRDVYLSQCKGSGKAIFNQKTDYAKSKRGQLLLGRKAIESDAFLTELEKLMVMYTKRISIVYNTVIEMQVLFSLEGCEQQMEHMDGVPGAGDFCSCIFTMDDNTHFSLNGRSITIPMCNLFIFHKNTNHAGGPSEHENIRIHAYIGATGCIIPRNGFTPSLQPCRWGCGRRFVNSTDMYNHHYRCKLSSRKLAGERPNDSGMARLIHSEDNVIDI